LSGACVDATILLALPARGFVDVVFGGGPTLLPAGLAGNSLDSNWDKTGNLQLNGGSERFFKSFGMTGFSLSPPLSNPATPLRASLIHGISLSEGSGSDHGVRRVVSVPV
jgi:hypothetical protein